MLEHVHHRVPVTALAFWTEHVILTGEAHYLRAYHVQTKELLANISVFEDQSIHGIVISREDPSIVVVWGGRYYRPLQVDAECHIRPYGLRKTSDWILDAAFSLPRSSSRTGELLGLVSAHNALSAIPTATLSAGEDQINVAEPIVPGSNCILYSAHISWLSASSCLIASGTAFGDVIVWSATFLQEDGNLCAQTQTHYTFSAHEGSVFGVRISDSYTDVGLRGIKRALATCSDDRTVRVWDISDLSTISPTLTEVQRETGFGSRSRDVEEFAPPCLAKTMGHVSRIWHVRFLTHLDPSGTQRTPPSSGDLMSFGEDATNISWALKPATSPAPPGLPYVLERLKVEAAHVGKHIWSVAQSACGCVATGGADGAVAVRPNAEAGVTTTEIGRNLLEDATDNFRAYNFVEHNTIVSTTDLGRILTVTFHPQGSASVHEVSPPLHGLRGYSIVTSVPAIAFIAGTDGIVYAYMHDHHRIYEIARTGQKTAGLFACLVNQSDDRKNLHLLITSVGNPIARLLQLETKARSSVDFCPTPTQEWQLTLPAGFIVTSFAMTSLEQSGCDRHRAVCLGARNSSIAIYDVHDAAEPGPLVHSAQIPNAHRKEAVTAMHLSSAEASGYDVLLHSTGRDGAYAVHTATRTDNGWQAHIAHQVTLPFGPNIEGIDIGDDRLWLWGFKSKHFVLYDAITQREIMNVECGGAHRHWALRPQAAGGTFVWTKASRLYQQTQDELPYSLSHSGGHGREIKAVALSPTSPPIIATGAEDTNIKLFAFDERGGELRCIQTLRKHNTGIQHLQWAHDGRRLFSSGGFEEFFIWKVTPGLRTIGAGVVCESAHPRSGTSDLRIMGFDAHERLDGSRDTGVSFGITMAYSDSSVKLWRFQSRNAAWALVATADYLTACLTHALQLPDEARSLVTAATDGHLATWSHGEHDGRATLAWNRRHRVHQNAILSAATTTLSDGSHLMITGGDDNAIGVTRIAPGGGGLADIQTLLVRRAHAAAVTGLALIPADDGRCLLLSGGVDQRVKVWQLSVDTDQAGAEGIAVELRTSAFTSVADASSLAAYPCRDGSCSLLVCGVGMGMWKVGPRG